MESLVEALAPATPDPPGRLAELEEENRLLRSRIAKLERIAARQPGIKAPASPGGAG